MKKLRNFLCVLLAVFFLTTAILPMTAVAADEAEKNKTVDFVLVLDCSGSLRTTDPSALCATACKMFLDMVPVENARVAILAYGYAGGGYTLTESHPVQNNEDLQLIHVITGLMDGNELQNKDVLKNTVSTVAANDGTKSPTGLATLCAVDFLEQSGAVDGNACVILVTDGQITSLKDYKADKTDNIQHAAQLAFSHQWPIYTIQLNKDEMNGPNSEPTLTMEYLAEKSGAGKEGHIQAIDFERGSDNISKAFIDIFDRFLSVGKGSGTSLPADEYGYVETSVEVPSLTSEYTIVVYGEGVDQVDIFNPGNPDVPKWSISKNKTEENLIATIDAGRYICVKLICPEAGTWKVCAHGNPNARIALYDCPMRDMDLVLSAIPEVPLGSTLLKSDTITLNAYLEYHGRRNPSKDYYEKTQPAIVIDLGNGAERTIKSMTATPDGYTFMLTLRDLGVSGDVTLRAKLEDTEAFTSGLKYSNPINLNLQNQFTQVKEDHAEVELKGNINCTFEKQDLNDYFFNPDGDEMTYDLVCISDRNVSFNYKIDDQGYLYIDCGMVPGTFQAELRAFEYGVTEPQICKMTLKVTDREIEALKDIPDAELWIEPFFLQEMGPGEFTLDLNDYFVDPDGAALSFEKLEYDEEMVDASLSGTKITITPCAKGKGEVTFNVFDGVGTIPVAIKVTVFSASGVFWSHNLPWMIPTLIALVVLTLILILRKKSRRVKGTWDITLRDDNGDESTFQGCNFVANTTEGKKTKANLKTILGEIAPFMCGSQNPVNTFSMFFCDGAERIMLCGVNAKKGCVVTDIPKNGCVSVIYNGLPTNDKPVKVDHGQVEIVLTNKQTGEKFSVILKVW